MKKTTLKDVANMAGVNFTLVSKYINNSPQARMTNETRERIEHAIKVLNYRPSVVARSLRNRSSKTIGMVIGNLTNEYCAHFADYTLRELSKCDYQLLLALTNEHDETEAIQTLLARDVDAVIWNHTSGKIPASCRCPIAVNNIFDSPYTEVNIELEQPLREAFSFVTGCSVAGLFFDHCFWYQLCEKVAPDATKYVLPIDTKLRLEELRSICETHSDVILTNGWQTATMLLELLDEEYPNYNPKIILHANCSGSFLSDKRIVGVITSSSIQLIETTVNALLEQLENSQSNPSKRTIPAAFIPAGTPEFQVLQSRHFQLI